jgi:hypothetical protein
MATTNTTNGIQIPQATNYLRTFYYGTTAQTVTVSICKSGGTFGAPSGGATATEISAGFYKIQLSSTDTSGLGDLAYSCTAGAGGPATWTDQIVTQTYGAATSGGAQLALDANNRVLVSSNLKQNAACNAFPFSLTISGQPAPGLANTLTIQRSLGAGGFGPIANPGSVVDLGGGDYTVNLAASDLNAPTVSLLITSTTADTVFINIITNP